MAIKLFIVIFIFINKNYGLMIETNKSDSNTLVKVKPVITDTNYLWLVNFVRRTDNKYESCQVMPIRRRVFIADAECIYRAAKVDHWSITVDFYHGSMRFSNMAYVKDKSIFYNEYLSSKYDPNMRRIAILISDQPVLSDDNKAFLMGIAQMAYQEVSGYDEANQIKRLPQNIKETNYSRCYMLVFRGTSINVPCYTLNLTFTSCMYELTDYTISQYDNLVNYLICHTKSSKEKVVLVGVLSESKKPNIYLHQQLVPVVFENVDNIDRIIRNKLREWFAANPYRPTYPLY